MIYSDIISIIEVILLLAVFIFLFRFVLMNFSSKVRKPLAWVKAVKAGNISTELRLAEKRYPDRIRFYTFWLQIERLKKDKVQGSLAELGVYKGETARVIHLCYPERKLHLFDTFEGFPAEDLVNETGKAAGYTTQHFADTNLDKVKSLMGDHPNIIYHKGYFPQTATNCKQEMFALVSMDADLYNPTKEGLEFFYPRLSDGGIILIHDYNDDWPELMRAVNEFASLHNISLVPVPDADSSVLIFK